MKVLRLSNCSIPLENMAQGMFKDISEMETYYLFNEGDSGPDFDKYDAVWFYTSEEFSRMRFPKLYEKAEKYEGRKVNWECVEGLCQDDMTSAWIDEGFPAPEFIDFPENHLAQYDEMPDGWDWPLMVKACREYTLYAYATIIYNNDDYAKWMKSNGHHRHMLQQYVPFEAPDGLYYCGQIHYIGGDIIVRSQRWSNHWYVSPTFRGEPHLGIKMGTLEGMPNADKITNFEEQVERIFQAVGVDIGNLDMSISKDGQIIPWGICTNFAVYSEANKERKLGMNHPHGSEQMIQQTKIVNKILDYFEIKERVSEKDLWRTSVAGNTVF